MCVSPNVLATASGANSASMISRSATSDARSVVRRALCPIRESKGESATTSRPATTLALPRLNYGRSAWAASSGAARRSKNGGPSSQ
jgi:hypothetical protein